MSYLNSPPQIVERAARSLTLHLAVHDSVGAAVANARLRRAVALVGRDRDDADPSGEVQRILDRYRAAFLGSAPRLSASGCARAIGWARAERSVLGGIDAWALRAERMNLDRLDLRELRIMRSAFRNVSLRGARFDHAAMDGTELRGIRLARSTWVGARVADCTFESAAFTHAVLDGARFERCSFHDVEIGGFLGTTIGTAFVECDLRGMRWAVGSIVGATFQDSRTCGTLGSTALDLRRASQAGEER